MRAYTPTEEGVTREMTFRIFYDVETSGRGCSRFSQDRIVEIAAVAVDAPGSADGIAGMTRRAVGAPDLLPEGFFSELVANGPSEHRAFVVHGISDEESRRGRPFAAVWSSLMAFCIEALNRFKATNECKRISFVGFNSFASDNYQLLAELRRAGLCFSEDLPPLIFEDVYPRTNEKKKALRCALQISNLKNTTVYEHATGKRVNSSSLHHALWDATATREAWLASEAVRSQTSRMSLEKQEAVFELLIARQRTEAMLEPVEDGEL